MNLTNSTEINADGTITAGDIRKLRTEAAQAGDHAQALICDIAVGDVDANEGYSHLRIWGFLSGADQRRIALLNQDSALESCVEVIEYARDRATNG